MPQPAKSVAALGLSSAMLLAAAPAAACSVVPGYRVPTNLELSVAADTIVVAEVVG